MKALNKNVKNEILEISFTQQKELIKESDKSNTFVAITLISVLTIAKILFLLFS